MQSLIGFITQFGLFWLAAYLALAGTYLIVGYGVTWLNRNRLSDMRIQRKECGAELVKRDFRQSLKSLVNIAAVLGAGFALREHGLGVPVAELSWKSALIWTPISLLLFDTWFYWGHRIIHHKKLYPKIHRWHHRTPTPTVWANNSDTFLDNLFCQSYWFFAPILLPAPTLILVGHKLYDQITGMLGHAGYEYAPGRFSAKPSPMIGTTFHDQHHSSFQYNFATHFSIWDRMMGTLHPEYDELITNFPLSDRSGANK